ncbi:hypothetical protein [Pseudomonas chlororaphis]|uniref:hypothetical protein n=1 Tax=Pseudomonas chlororaphis TaxID=587753 RepID=UPI001CF156C8|nr:hypothetical protein [Pseudomonas chlororaphis]UCR83821.1 hypothetical protein K9V45_27035 [Pseudomonas chlororaphis]
MASSISRSLYWLGAAAAVALLLYYLLPTTQDSPYMKLHSTGDGSVFTGCEFSSIKQDLPAFRFSMSPQACRLVRYDGSSGIELTLEYPTAEVVSDDAKGSRYPIALFIEHISMEGFDADRHLRGKSPVALADGIEGYEVGGFQERKFTGKDGVSVYVSDYLATVRANRLYGSGLWVFYQYPKELTDVRAVDDFVLGALGNVLAG